VGPSGSARNQVPVPLPVLPSLADANPPNERDSPQDVRFKRLRGHIFVQAQLQLLTAVYEEVTHRVYGRTFALQADAQNWETLHNLPPIRPFNTESVTISAPLSAITSVSCRLICWSSCSSASINPHACYPFLQPADEQSIPSGWPSNRI
jgi:hypothetical protein